MHQRSLAGYESGMLKLHGQPLKLLGHQDTEHFYINNKSNEYVQCERGHS